MIREITPEIASACKAAAQKVQARDSTNKYVFVPDHGYENESPQGQLTFVEVIDFLLDKDRILHYCPYECDSPDELVNRVHELISGNEHREIYKPSGYFKKYDAAEAAAQNSKRAQEQKNKTIRNLISEIEKKIWDNGGGASGMKPIVNGMYGDGDKWVNAIRETYGKWASKSFNIIRYEPLGSRISNDGASENELREKAQSIANKYASALQRATPGVKFMGKDVKAVIVNTYYPIFTTSDYSDDGDDSYETVFLIRLTVVD